MILRGWQIRWISWDEDTGEGYRVEDISQVVFLETIYEKLKEKRVPNVDRLMRTETAHSKLGCFIELEPRGDTKGPSSADDIKNAVTCVLETLQVLHAAPPMFHRDIRWPNVMKNIAEPKRWFLINALTGRMHPSARQKQPPTCVKRRMRHRSSRMAMGQRSIFGVLVTSFKPHKWLTFLKTFGR